MSGTTNREMDEHQPILVPRVGNATFLASFSLFLFSLCKQTTGPSLVRQSRLPLSSTKTYHYIIIIIISFKDGRGREGLEEIMEEIAEAKT